MRKLRGLVSSAVAVAVIAGAAPAGAEGAAPPGPSSPARAGAEATPATPEERHVRRLLYDLQNDGDPTAETVELGVEIFYDSPTSNPASVVQAMQLTPEGRGATVEDLFVDLLRRHVDAPSRQFFSGRLDRVGQIKVRADLVASNEYYVTQGGGTDEGWVAAFYRDLLGRPGDVGGRQYYLDELARGRSRGSIASAVSGGGDGRFHLVQKIFSEVLRRGGDLSTRAYYVERLKDGWTVERLITHLVTRAEYVTRARAPLGDASIVILADGNELISTTVQGSAETRLAITGLAVGEQVLGIHSPNPADPLYGITSLGRLVAIDRADGSAEAIGVPIPGFAADGRPVGIGRYVIGFDAAQVQVVEGDTGYRLDQQTGAVEDVFTFAYDDRDVEDGAMPVPRGLGLHPFSSGELGAGTQSLFLDEATSSRATVVDELDGIATLATLDPLHMPGVAVLGFDLYGQPAGTGYAVLDAPHGGLGLYRFDGYSGEPRLVATLGEDEVLGLTVVGQA